MRWALLTIFVCGCGAGSRAAPFSESGKELTGCGEIADVAPHLLAFVRSQNMEPVAEVLQTQLVAPGLIQNAFAGLIKIIAKAPPPAGLLTPLNQVIVDPKSAPLAELVGNLMRYLAGVAPATASHYAVTTAFGRVLTDCDHNGPLTLVDKLVTTHLPYGCTPLSAGCDLASNRLLTAADNLLSNTSIRTLLSGINLNAVPADSFVILLQQATTILASPTYDFAQIRDLVQTNLYPLITDAALKSQLDALLAIIDQVSQPQTGIQQALVGTLSCVTAKDPNGAIDRMVFDLISDPNLKVVELLGGLSDLGNADPQEKLAGWLHQVIGLLESDPSTNNALITLIATILEEKNAELMIPALVKMGDAGVLSDLSALVKRELTPCSQRPIGTATGSSGGSSAGSTGGGSSSGNVVATSDGASQ